MENLTETEIDALVSSLTASGCLLLVCIDQNGNATAASGTLTKAQAALLRMTADGLDKEAEQEAAQS